MSETTNGGYAGHLAYEYINTATKASPTLARLKRAGDISHPDERGTSEIIVKGSDFEKSILTVRKKGVAFKYTKKRATDPVYDELKAVYEDPTKCLEYVASDQDITVNGAKGFRGPFVVTKFDEDVSSDNAVTVNVELKVADADDPESPGDDWEVTAFTTSV